ncbi:MAG: hypothetical protein ABEI39_03730 [Halobacteriales archaeon]
MSTPVNRENRGRRVSLVLASVALTLSLAVLGGNLRRGAGAVTNWMQWQQVLFVLCLVEGVLIGWPPARDFWHGEWQPFLDASLASINDDNN